MSFSIETGYTGAYLTKAPDSLVSNSRYYDPEDAIFLLQDTYRGENTDPSSLHLYAYCAGNPINFIDPSGHKYSRESAASYGIHQGKPGKQGLPIFAYFEGADCANFVSQCLFMGGKSFRGENLNYGNDNAWYSKKSAVKGDNYSKTNPNLNKISYSWREKNVFKMFWSNNNRSTVTMKKKKVKNKPDFMKWVLKNKIQKGDAAQF